MTSACSSVPYIGSHKKCCMKDVQHSDLDQVGWIIAWLGSIKPIGEELGMKILEGWVLLILGIWRFPLLASPVDISNLGFWQTTYECQSVQVHLWFNECLYNVAEQVGHWTEQVGHWTKLTCVGHTEMSLGNPRCARGCRDLCWDLTRNGEI